MPGENPFYTWPIADQTTMIWAMCVILAFLGGAFGLELFRRRRDRRLRLEAEWRAVQQIVSEKEMPAEEWALLETLLRQYGARQPYQSVTLRSHFDACVDNCLHALRAQNDFEKLERFGVRLRDIRVRLGLDLVPWGQRIHSTRDLYTDQMVWAAPAKDAMADWYRMYVSHLDEAHFYLMAHEGQTLPEVKPKDQVRFRMWRDEDARYVFTASLVRIEKSPRAWMFQHSQDLKRMQSRAYYRIPYEQASTFGVMTAAVDGDLTDIAKRQVITQVRGRTTSLSGGGFAAILTDALPKQVLLQWELALGLDNAPFRVYAKVVSAQSISGGRYIVRGAFVNLGDEERDQIAQYVMKKQRYLQSGEARHDQEQEKGIGTS